MTFKQKEFNFKDYGAFFAFSEEQLIKGLNGRDRKHFVTIPGFNGLVAHKDNIKNMFSDLKSHTESERKRRIKEVGLEDIIKYELANYEAYYTYDISDTFDVVKDYGATTEQVLEIFKKELALH